MKWLGITAAVVTLAAVVLNSIWFTRYGGLSAAEFLRLSAPTVFYLALFIGAVFLVAWGTGRLLARMDAEEKARSESPPTQERSPSDDEG